MDKSKKTSDKLQRQCFGRRSFYRTPKQERNKTSGKSEKLKELTKLLKNTNINHTYSEQPSLLRQNKPRHTSLKIINCEEAEGTMPLSTLEKSKNQDDYNQWCLNEFQAKISNLKISYLEKTCNTRLKSVTNLSPLIPLNKEILTKLFQQEYGLLTESQRDILIRSSSFSQIERYSCKFITNLKNFQDQIHQDNITIHYDANLPTKIKSELKGYENKTIANICYVQLQYGGELPVNSCSNISTSMDDDDIIMYPNRSLVHQCKNSQEYNRLAVEKMSALNSELFTQTKAASTPSKIEHIGTSDDSKSNYPYNFYKNSLDDLRSHDRKCYLKLERAVSEAILSHIKYYTQYLSPSTNISIKEIRQVKPNRLFTEASMVTKSRGRNIFQEDMFSPPDFLAELLHGSEEKLFSDQQREMFTVSTI